MRIIAGTAKGRRLQCPPKNVRPTSDRVKEALFHILGPFFPVVPYSTSVPAAVPLA
nr:RsmD family RNA methyltransferase [Pasteuria penetrans]